MSILLEMSSQAGDRSGSNLKSEQAAMWNGGSGRAWIELKDMFDQMFAGLAERLVAVVAESAATRVLDVGCGTGATTVAIAQQLGTSGSCVGVDISQPMLTAARERASAHDTAVEFVIADIERDSLPQPKFDLIVSRFGVMFFADPVVAFNRLRVAATDNGSLCLLVWRPPADNPFMTAAESAVAPLIALPPREIDVPGPFGLASAGRTRTILERAGWSEIEIAPVEFACRLPETDLVPYITRMGPLSRALVATEENQRRALIDRALSGFDRYIEAGDVRFTAACWQITARS